MENRKRRAVLIVAQIIMFSLIVVPIAAGGILANDTLDGAIAMVDDDLVWTDTTGATISVEEPAPGCNLVGDTLTWMVWFKFETTYTGIVRLDARLPYKGGGLRQYMSIYEITSAGPPATLGGAVGCGSGQMINMQDFSVTAGKQYAVAVSGVNEYLGSSLSVEFQTTALLQGTVTNESTNPLEGIKIQILTPDGGLQLNKVVIKTALEGTWEATVPTRPLVVKFSDFYGVYGTEYYDNATTLTAATTLTPATDTTVGGIDAVLSTAASVSGRVTDTNGNPIPNSYVYVYDVPFTGSYTLGIQTDANGDYTLLGLNSGDYLLKFAGVGYYVEWWDNMPDQASATTTSITAGANTGYNAQLVKVARITGVVTDDLGQPIPGVKVFIYDGPGSIYKSPITATDGSYIVDGVPPGEYTVYADANFPVTGAYGSEWWDNLPSSTAYADVGKIAIVDGTLASADFALNRSVLSGTVTSTDDGLPIEGVLVTVTNDAASQLGQTTTDANGAYSFEAFLFATPPLRLDFEATSVSFVDGQTTGIAFSAGANVTADKALDPDQQPPVVDYGSTFSIPESVSIGSVVGTATGNDPNRGDTLTWSITGGNAADAFTIDAATGQITTATALDYETTTYYMLTVAISDGTSQDTAVVRINVTDVVETPPPPPAGETRHRVALVNPASGKWYLYDDTGVLTTTFFFGNPGDYPFMGDWDGDGVETPGLYRQSDGFVYLSNSNTQGLADIRFYFGNPGDVPLAGDFNGDGFDTVSIYRPSNQTIYIINELGSNDGGLGPAEFSYVFGNPGDKPFVGDFDGDGVETVGLHRESTGLVYFRNKHSRGNADNEFIFGDPGDRIVAGDWNGNGAFTPALFRPSNTTMYFRYTNTRGNADEYFVAGEAGWIPVSGR